MTAVTISSTPNENAMKFTLDKNAIESGYQTFNNAEDAESVPAAKALFAIEGVVSVFFMADFITVTKSPDASWEAIQGLAVDAIKGNFE